MRTMYDAVDVLSLPDGADLYAGYDDGNWPDADAIAARFPGKPVVRITVNPADDEGTCLDVETGDASPGDGPSWILKRRQQGIDPSEYCSLDNWLACRQAFVGTGIPEPHWWIAAAPGIGAALYPDSVAHQYAQDGGGSYDISVVADYWPGIDPPLSPPMVYPDDVKRIDVTPGVLISGYGGNLTKAQIPDWDGSCPISVIEWGSNGPSPIKFQGWSADGRLDFTGTDGGPYGFSLWVPA